VSGSEAGANGVARVQNALVGNGVLKFALNLLEKHTKSIGPFLGEPIDSLHKIKSRERTIKTSMLMIYPSESVSLVSARRQGAGVYTLLLFPTTPLPATAHFLRGPLSKSNRTRTLPPAQLAKLLKTWSLLREPGRPQPEGGL